MKKIARTRVIGREKSPINVNLVAPKNRRKTNIGLDITPFHFRRAMKSAKAGEPAALYAIMEQFFQVDDEIPASMQTLSAGVLAEGWTITPMNDSPEAQRQAEIYKDIFDKLSTHELMQELLELHYYGMRPVFLEWGQMQAGSARYQVPVSWEKLPQHYLYAERQHPNDTFNTLYVGDRPYADYPRGSVLLGLSDKLPSFQDIDFTKFGKGLGCIRFAIMKYYDVEDWAAFNESFATPLILGQLTEGWNEKDKNLLEQAVGDLANDSRAVTTSRGSISFPSAQKTSSVDAFDRFLEVMNRIISVKMKSESQTDQMNKHGSNAAMITAYGIQLNVARSLSNRLKELFRRDIMMPIARQNFGGNLLCQLHLPVRAVDNLDMQSKIDERLQRMGFPLSQREAAERYGRSVAEDDDLLESARVNLFGGQ